MATTAWLVVAGGLGTRYGEPKYAAQFEGSTFLERCLELIRSVAAPGDIVLVALREDQPWSPPAGVTVVRDDPRVSGPVAGLLAGVSVFGTQGSESGWPDVLVTMPVDMPYLTQRVLSALRDTADQQRTVTVVRSLGSGDTHWPLAAYPGPSLPVVGELISAGRRSLRDIAHALGFGVLVVDDETARNINVKPT